MAKPADIEPRDIDAATDFSLSGYNGGGVRASFKGKEGRFERSEGDTLCQKSPKKDGEAQETDLPCLVCMDRLVKIEKSLNN